MKKMLLLSATILFIQLLSFAGRPQTLLSVSVLTNYPVRIVVNGVNYNSWTNRESGLILNNLRPGYHRIQVFRQDRCGNGRSSLSGSVLYRGTVFLKNGFHTDMVINRFGNAFQDEMLIGRHHDAYYGNGGFDAGSGMGMEKSRFDEMKNSLRLIAFEDTRLQTCKQLVSSNSLSSGQVKELMQLFSFEANKLEIARFAYSQTADPENYPNIYDAFSFNSSRDEMNRFLQNER